MESADQISSSMAHLGALLLALFQLISRPFRAVCAMREGDRNRAREVRLEDPNKRLLGGRQVGSSARRAADDPGSGAAQARWLLIETTSPVR
ncbi:hypothetical protein [Nocardia asiatica]